MESSITRFTLEIEAVFAHGEAKEIISGLETARNFLLRFNKTEKSADTSAVLGAMSPILFLRLPKSVVTLATESGISVSRDSAELEQISREDRKTWTLGDLEEYGKRMATKHNVAWTTKS
jgi:hypothetical protein